MKQRCGGTTIYALCHPVTGEIRYIGKAVKPEMRYACHLSDARRRESHCARWVRSVGRPIMRALVVVPDSDGPEMEIRTIAHFRTLGYRLTNITAGGDGALGRIASAETLAKMSASHRGHLTSEETREKMRKAHRERPPTPREQLASCGFRGHVHSSEAKAKLAAARRSHITTEAAREANRMGQLGRKHSPETIAKMCASQRGHSVSDATRAKIAAAALGRKLKVKRFRTKPHSAEELSNLSAASRASWARRKAVA